MEKWITRIVICILVITLSGCMKEQYKGHHLHTSRQQELKDEHNNYHVKETQRVLDNNVQQKEKREKKAEKERMSQVKSAKSLKGKKKLSLDFDWY